MFGADPLSRRGAVRETGPKPYCIWIEPAASLRAIGRRKTPVLQDGLRRNNPGELRAPCDSWPRVERTGVCRRPVAPRDNDSLRTQHTLSPDGGSRGQPDTARSRRPSEAWSPQFEAAPAGAADASRATALTRADFFANQAVDRVLNPVKSTKIHSHYAVVAAKHERCSGGQSTCVRNHSITNTSSASGRLRPPMFTPTRQCLGIALRCNFFP